MNNIISLFVYIHAALGGIGLISGLSVFVFKKGTLLHKQIGRAFYYSMMFSCLISMIICLLPGKSNLFLFLVGCMTIYMLLTGERALRLRSPSNYTNWADYLILYTMMIAAILFLFWGIIQYVNGGSNYVLFMFFGGLSTFLTFGDWVNIRNYQTNRNKFLITHITRMAGAYIASVTAFLVAGLHLDSLVFWIAPTIIGSLVITYYVNKYSIKKSQKKLVHE